MKKRIFVIGGDGFCGWPTALHLSKLGHEIVILDNLSRRTIDSEMGANSLTPIAPMNTRIDAWKEVSGNSIDFENIDVAIEYDRLEALINLHQPDAIIHFGEQRAAPYSMKGAVEKRYTVDNNISATHNVLVALTKLGLDTHLIHLGTMGVYGYDDDGIEIPEGYLKVFVPDDKQNLFTRHILYPTIPGSVYHMS